MLVLVCWLTWRDPRAARTVVWAALVLMATSLRCTSGGSCGRRQSHDYSWAYQFTAVAKHGCELAGWLLLATGIIAGIEGRPRRVRNRDRSHGTSPRRWAPSRPDPRPRAPLTRAAGRLSPQKPIDARSVDQATYTRKWRNALLNGLMMDDFQLSLTTLVERAEQLSPTSEVVARLGDGSIRRMKIGECTQRARRLATGLAALGVDAGDRVATLLWNQTEHLELYFAVPLMGAVLHTLNPRLSDDDLSYIAADARDRIIVVDESLLHLLDGIDWDFQQVIVVSASDSAPPEAIRYESLIDTSDPMVWPAIDERQAAAMCYTSGTTGRPKGVIYSHRALVLHSLVFALPDALGISSAEVLLPVVPMFHVNAWGLPFTAALTGAKLVLPGPRLDPVSLLDLTADEHVTFAAGVPTVWMAVLDAINADPDRWDLSALRRVNLGGAAVPASLIAGFERHGSADHSGMGHDGDDAARHDLAPA